MLQTLWSDMGYYSREDDDEVEKVHKTVIPEQHDVHTSIDLLLWLLPWVRFRTENYL